MALNKDVNKHLGKNKGGDRESFYDWLRLIATILVVLGHSAYLKITTTYGGVSYVIPDQVNGIYYSAFFAEWRFLAGWVYQFHMPLFFILSGAVLALRTIESIDVVIRKKINRLLIPYFLTGLFFMLPVKYWGGFYDTAGLKKAFTGFLSGADSGHLWFLAALFWCIIAFSIIEKILKKFCVESEYLPLLLCGILQLTCSYMPFDVLLMKKGLSYIFWFALGYVLQRERKRHVEWGLRKITLSLLITFGIEYFQCKYALLNTFFSIICGSFLMYLLADLCNRFFKFFVSSKAWNILIRNLFYVYLFHDSMEYLVLRVFMGPHNYMSTATGCCLYMFLRTMGVFLISILLGELVEKTRRVLRVHLES